MSWFRRKPTRTPDPRAADIRVARREVRRAEWEYEHLDDPTNHQRVRDIAARHHHWRQHLHTLGVNHPAYPFTW